jgi:indole-3-glycerol phosphate synthase
MARRHLEGILVHARATAAALRPRRRELERAAAAAPPPPRFAAALVGPTVGVIAELKRKSPSAGAINPSMALDQRARLYADAGAAAISVLTDEPSFGGSLDDLELVVASVSVPVLRKDFLLAEEQLLEARAAGASAALLIARALPGPALERLVRFAGETELDVLVEVHDAAELDRALHSGARIIGVNCRDLDTFDLHRDRADQLLAAVPADRIAVAESGIRTAEDVAAAAVLGADAVLVGTALSAASDPTQLAAALARVPRRGR